MAREISFLPSALEEARIARLDYRAVNDALAADFLERLDHALSMVQERPEAWPRGARNTRRYLMQRFPYAVVYRIEGDGILVVAVAHLSREPGYWKRRVLPR